MLSNATEVDRLSSCGFLVFIFVELLESQKSSFSMFLLLKGLKTKLIYLILQTRLENLCGLSL